RSPPAECLSPPLPNGQDSLHPLNYLLLILRAQQCLEDGFTVGLPSRSSHSWHHKAQHLLPLGLEAVNIFLLASAMFSIPCLSNVPICLSCASADHGPPF
ncbi:hypothetical protein KUCAC02_009909, partial [Chaenocephalus aceratus]